MPSIQIPAFTGLNLRAAPHLLKPGEATWAHDCVLDSGAIVPLKGATTPVASVDPATKSIYRWWAGSFWSWESSTADRWYAETSQYLYWADGGVPKAYRKHWGQFNLGIPAPVTAPGFDATPSGHGEITDRQQFAVTFFSDPLTGGLGAESAPILLKSITGSFRNPAISVAMPMDIVSSTATEFKVTSNPLSAGFNEFGGYIEVDLGFGQRERIRYSGTRYDGSSYYFTGLHRGQLGTTARDISGGTVYAYGSSHLALVGIPVSSDPKVNARRIYRLSAGEYKLVAQIPDNTATTLAATPMQDGDIAGAAILTSDNNDPPPNLKGIVGPHNGMLFGWLDNKLRWTKVGDFHAWPEEYTFDDFPTDIACAAIWGGFLVVFTQDGVYTVNGSSPEALSRFKVQGTRGTPYPRSVTSIGSGLLYVSTYGVEVFDGLASRSLSYDKLGDRVTLTNPRVGFLRGRAYIFHDGGSLNGKSVSAGCLIADLRAGEAVWTTSGITSPLAYVLPALDQMYLVSGSTIVEWETGGAQAWSWQSGILAEDDLKQGKILTMLRADVNGSVNITTTPDGNGMASHTVALSGYRQFVRKRLPTKVGTVGRRLKHFNFSASGTGEVHSLGFEYF